MQVCLFGASSPRVAPMYVEATEQLGALLAEAGHTLVYGAGGAGLMGAAARGVKSRGGRVIGVVPSFLKVDGILYDACDEMIFTETMGERKAIMEDRADGFVVVPGGIGTYEELFEVYTLKQLGRHQKPIVVYNIGGYYDETLAMLHKTVAQEYMPPASLELIAVETTAPGVLQRLTELPGDTADIHRTKYVQTDISRK